MITNVNSHLSSLTDGAALGGQAGQVRGGEAPGGDTPGGGQRQIRK